ncbi:MAG: hypothetical protein ACP5PX_05870 [Candidatus Hadarchaeum sp.]|uniref:hypothetical protein n=1 Tax=Candidatus Hadarchaeum sp. TaxID=2883567 RepID=UPI003D0F1B1E
MDEFTFRAAYAIFGAVLLALLFFIFSRKLDRKLFAVPVVVGFLFSAITAQFIGGGVASPLFGGVLTGYLVKNTTKWSTLFRAGAANAALTLAALFLPAHLTLYQTSLADLLAMISTAGYTITAEQFLYLLISNYLLYFVTIFTFLTGTGAILGNYLRRVLMPKQHL